MNGSDAYRDLQFEFLLHVPVNILGGRILHSWEHMSTRDEAKTFNSPPKISAGSIVSSRPIKMSRCTLDWGSAGMCGFCDSI